MWGADVGDTEAVERARDRRAGRFARRVAETALLAVGAFLLIGGAPWLSANADEPTPEPSPTASPEPSSSLPEFPWPVSVVDWPLDLPCSALGMTELEPGPTSGSWLPEWVSSPESVRCVLIVDSLRPPESETTTEDDSQTPPLSGSPEQVQAILDNLEGSRTLILYVGGLLIFLSAIQTVKSRD